MKIVTVALALVLVLTLACNGVAPTATATPTPEPTPEDKLKERIETINEVIATREWAKLYDMYSDEFKEACSSKEFVDHTAYLVIRIHNGLDGLYTAVQFGRIEGDKAWLDWVYEIEVEEPLEGVARSLHRVTSTPIDPAFTWTGGEWIYYISPDENLLGECNTPIWHLPLPI